MERGPEPRAGAGSLEQRGVRASSMPRTGTVWSEQGKRVEITLAWQESGGHM